MSKRGERPRSQVPSVRRQIWLQIGAGLTAAIGMSAISCGQSTTDVTKCGPGTVQNGAECLPSSSDASTYDAYGQDAQPNSDAANDVVSPEPICSKTGKCPTGPMVTVDRPAANGGPYQIDAYETTVGEYDRFLSDVKAGLVPVQIDQHCAWNLTYEP